jgi:hypothetical protein
MFLLPMAKNNPELEWRIPIRDKWQRSGNKWNIQLTSAVWPMGLRLGCRVHRQLSYISDVSVYVPFILIYIAFTFFWISLYTAILIFVFQRMKLVTKTLVSHLIFFYAIHTS